MPTHSMRPKPSLRASCPTERFGARRERFGTALILRLPAPCHVAAQGLPASARYRAPRRRGVAALRALRFAQARASATASPRWPCASRAPLLGSSHARVRVRLPFGPARAIRHPSCRGRVLRAGRICAHPFASVALRAWSPQPHLAALAPRRVRLRLTPSPCSRRRAKPPTPFAFPSRAAALQICSHRAAPAALPCPRRPPCASGVEWLALLAAVSSKGARRRALATPWLGGNWLRASLARCRGAAPAMRHGSVVACAARRPGCAIKPQPHTLFPSDADILPLMWRNIVEH